MSRPIADREDRMLAYYINLIKQGEEGNKKKLKDESVDDNTDKKDKQKEKTDKSDKADHHKPEKKADEYKQKEDHIHKEENRSKEDHKQRVVDHQREDQRDMAVDQTDDQEHETVDHQNSEKHRFVVEHLKPDLEEQPNEQVEEQKKEEDVKAAGKYEEEMEDEEEKKEPHQGKAGEPMTVDTEEIKDPTVIKRRVGRPRKEDRVPKLIIEKPQKPVKLISPRKSLAQMEADRIIATILVDQRRPPKSRWEEEVEEVEEVEEAPVKKKPEVLKTREEQSIVKRGPGRPPKKKYDEPRPPRVKTTVSLPVSPTARVAIVRPAPRAADDNVRSLSRTTSNWGGLIETHCDQLPIVTDFTFHPKVDMDAWWKKSVGLDVLDYEQELMEQLETLGKLCRNSKDLRVVFESH